MQYDLWKAATFSLAVHAGLMVSGWSSQPAVVDVERSLVSLEVELFSAAQLPSLPLHSRQRREDSPVANMRVGGPSPQNLVEGHGAATEAKPQALRNRPPFYPWLARMQGWEGTVVLQVRVEPDGRASQVQILKRSGHPTLDQAAQQAVSQWEFLPAQRGGRVVASTVKVPVRFRLTENDKHEP